MSGYGASVTDAESTRDRILEAAKQEFAQEGFAGARVDAIARLAGANKQLIYHYFGDKEGLFKAVMTHVMSQRPPLDFRSRADFAAQFGHIFEDMSKKRMWMGCSRIFRTQPRDFSTSSAAELAAG